MANGNELREFLVSGRARITPEQAKLPAYGGNRRVAGLRREEVAMLAGVSVDYYTKLERGAAGVVPESVLDAVARALQLTPNERDHLFHLTGTTASLRTISRPEPAFVRPTMPLREGRARLAAGAVMVAGALALAGCTTTAATGRDDASASLPGAGPSVGIDDVALVPDSGVALGIYYGDGDQLSTDAAIGATPLIDLTYFGWDDAWTTSPVLAADASRGQISLVNWEPFEVDFADIVDGVYDEMLTRRAQEAAGLAAPVFLDFAAEMNEEEGWGGHDPQLYKAAYRHLHDIFAGNDGGNVVWVWAPNNVDSADAPAAMEYYPGDDYVDWTGIDGYNWGTSDPDFEWQSFEQVFRDVYDDLHALGKPIIIGETASAEDGGSKAEWISDILPTLLHDFPDIRALVWFDVDKERDWRIRSSAESLDAFRRLAADPTIRTTSH